MSNPTSPSVPDIAVKMALRENRSLQKNQSMIVKKQRKQVLQDNNNNVGQELALPRNNQGLQDVNDFWKSQKEESAVTVVSSSNTKPKKTKPKPQQQPAADTNSKRSVRPRFSLPSSRLADTPSSLDAIADTATLTPAVHRAQNLVRNIQQVLTSPSALSPVSTEPPTPPQPPTSASIPTPQLPKSSISPTPTTIPKQEDDEDHDANAVEAARQAIRSDEMAILTLEESSKSPQEASTPDKILSSSPPPEEETEFPQDDDDDEEEEQDDLLPPPPPEEENDEDLFSPPKLDQDGDIEMDGNGSKGTPSDAAVEQEEDILKLDSKNKERIAEEKLPSVDEMIHHSEKNGNKSDYAAVSEHTSKFEEEEEQDGVIKTPTRRSSKARLSIKDDDEEYEFDGAVDDDDDDDDDKEGVGFQMIPQDDQVDDEPSSPEVPMETILSPPRKRKSTTPPSLEDEEDYKDNSDDGNDEDDEGKEEEAVVETPKSYRSRAKQKRSRAKRDVVFSPQGYPAGNRGYETVPISAYRQAPSPSSRGLRRSKRPRIKPLAFWKNERPIYEAHNEKGLLGDAMGSMPVVSGVLQALPTPYRKRKPMKRTNAGGSAKKPRAKKKKDDSEEVTPFDSTNLRQKYRFMEGEEAQVWDERLEDAVDQKVVSIAGRLAKHVTELPLPNTRDRSEGSVVGVAAQAFNVSSSDDVTSPYVGYIMGNLLLPPGGIKDPESTGACSQVFTVCRCQPQSLEVAYGDPHEEEGSLSPNTAQRFLLSEQDQFRIPPGNAYRLHNHSTTTDCVLAWTIVRPHATIHKQDNTKAK